MCFTARLFVISVFTFLFACNSENVQTQSEIFQSNQSVNKSETAQKENLIELLNDRNEFPSNLRNKWKEFTANGQYRLAQKSDMTFSEQAKNQLPGRGESMISYEYSWGDLNYSKRIGDDHLAAIVVVATKNNSSKFNLVIFSPNKNTKDGYDINWLYRDTDLSKTTLHRASGELFIEQFSDDGSRKACSVNWNKRLKKFECK